MTSTAKEYILDTNVFIEARDACYGFDICPAFWEFMITQYRQQRLYSIDEVEEELHPDEEIIKWLKKSRVKDTGFFQDTKDPRVKQKHQEIVAYVNASSQYFTEAKEKFLNGADPWLIAYAAVHGCVLVTHEQKAPDAKKTVPMPNICDEFGVECCDTYEMLKELGARFVLD